MPNFKIADLENADGKHAGSQNRGMLEARDTGAYDPPVRVPFHPSANQRLASQLAAASDIGDSSTLLPRTGVSATDLAGAAGIGVTGGFASARSPLFAIGATALGVIALGSWLKFKIEGEASHPATKEMLVDGVILAGTALLASKFGGLRLGRPIFDHLAGKEAIRQVNEFVPHAQLQLEANSQKIRQLLDSGRRDHWHINEDDMNSVVIEVSRQGSAMAILPDRGMHTVLPDGGSISAIPLGPKVRTYSDGTQVWYHQDTGRMGVVPPDQGKATEFGEKVEGLARTANQRLWPYEIENTAANRLYHALFSDHAESLLAPVPQNTQYRGAGSYAVALKAPDETVFRVQPYGVSHRPKIDEMLPAIKTFRGADDAWQVEQLPHAKPVWFGWRFLHLLEESVQRKGYEPIDSVSRNVARGPDGRVVYIDPGAIEMLSPSVLIGRLL